MSERAPATLYAKLVAVAAIWGGTFIAARVVAPLMSAPAAVAVALPRRDRGAGARSCWSTSADCRGSRARSGSA